jgi:dihydroxycyclohexadiene carboxylate dehydrogenase
MSADNGAVNETAAAGLPESFHAGRFASKVVLITGAAQGIGWAVARRIAAEGGDLVLVDRSPLVHDVAEGLRTHGVKALSVTADLEAFEGALSAVTAAVTEYGRIDVLINNVGGTIWAKPFEHYAPEEISKEIQRSLFPTLWMCRAAFPEMIKAGSGTIVNVSSVATRGLNRVPYAGAKGGVKAITSALAMEGAAHGIRVVATAPGGTEAPERQVKRGPSPEGEQEKAWYQQIVDQTIDSTLMKRYGTLDEQAGPIAFLASDEASYITGSTLAVAGGDLG